MVFAQNSSDFIYQKCYQRYRQADHRLLSSLPSYSRETAPLLWACGTYWLSAGSPSGYWSVAPTAQSLKETLRTPTFHLAEGINSDVQSVNIGIHSAWRKASDCTHWRRIVDMTTLHRGTPLKRVSHMALHNRRPLRQFFVYSNQVKYSTAKSLCEIDVSV